MRKAIFLLSVFSLSTGCVTSYTKLPGSNLARQQISSGLIGCPPKEIDIKYTNYAGPLYSTKITLWEATCRGHKFYCSMTTENKDSFETFCTESLKQVTKN